MTPLLSFSRDSTRSHLNRGNNLVVGSTAADIALKRLLDFWLGRRGIFSKQGHAGQDHSRGAVTALHGIALNEGFLYRMQTIAVGDAFNGCDLLACHTGDGGDARAVWNAIDQNRAGSALALTASVLGAGEIQLIPQNEEQWPFRINGHAYAFAIHNQVHRAILDGFALTAGEDRIGAEGRVLLQ
jgi:hypothetical protein